MDDAQKSEGRGARTGSFCCGTKGVNVQFTMIIPQRAVLFGGSLLLMGGTTCRLFPLSPSRDIQPLGDRCFTLPDALVERDISVRIIKGVLLTLLLLR